MNFNITPEEAKKQFTTLTFNGKRLIADIFGRHTLTFVAEIENKTITLSAFFTVNGKEIHEVDHLFQGPPLGIIKGISLYFIETFAPYSLVKSCPRQIDISFLKELMDDYPVIVLGEIPKETPKLQWLDPYGMTAKLLTSDHESELIKAGYRKQPYNFYCPKTEVFKTTELLKAGGWEIVNQEEKEIAPLSSFRIETRITDQVEVTGELKFGEEIIPLDPSLKLPSGKVALLPDNFKLKTLLSQAKREGDKLILPKKLAGLVIESFTPPEKAPVHFKGELRPYQQMGLNWLHFLYEKGFSGLLADDMGLGKTVQTLAFLANLKGPILIIAPTSLLVNWQREIERFCEGLSYSIYHGNHRASNFETSVVITSYALIRNDLPHFQKVQWDAIIVDEAQLMKNQASQTFQAIHSLKSSFKLAMTGTPVENHLDELKAHFKFLMPDLIDASDDITLIKRKIAPYTLRRTKKEVLRELPERVEKTIFVEMTPSQKEAYQNLLDGAQSEMALTENPIQILEMILRLRQMACHPLLTGSNLNESGKLEMIISDIKTLLDEKQKIIVFSQFTSFLKIIRKEVGDSLYLDGETRNRQDIVDTFQNDESQPLLLMSLKAGGVGLNLTRADQILIVDPWWNEAVEDQAISRSHRMGRKDPVFARRYVSIDTIEEKIELLKREKKDLFNQLFNSEKDLIKIIKK